MDKADYQRTLNELRQRYSDLRDQRRAVTAEMIRLLRAIEGLAELCGEPPNVVPPEEQTATEAGKLLVETWLKSLPFVDAIRLALRIVYPSSFTTSDLRELLKRVGYPIEAKSDPMVALNVALKRLLESGEVEISTQDEWRKAYRWAFKNELAPVPAPTWEEPKIDWKALVREADRVAEEISGDAASSKARRSRGASNSFDSGWIPGFGEVPGGKK